MATVDISAQRLRELLDYNQETGILNWRRRPREMFRDTRMFNTWNTRYAGAEAGAVCNGKYLYINVLGSNILAHRIIWMMIHGEWPNGVIDHINGKKRDNRIENLRDVSGRINSENRQTAQPSKKSELPLGVFITKRARKPKFRANIRHEGRQKYLGCYDTPEKAHAAYLQAKRLLHKGCTI